jgi:hypothetical protein
VRRARGHAPGLAGLGPVPGGPIDRNGRVSGRRSCAEVAGSAGDYLVALGASGAGGGTARMVLSLLTRSDRAWSDVLRRAIGRN